MTNKSIVMNSGRIIELHSKDTIQTNSDSCDIFDSTGRRILSVPVWLIKDILGFDKK